MKVYVMVFLLFVIALTSNAQIQQGSLITAKTEPSSFFEEEQGWLFPMTKEEYDKLVKMVSRPNFVIIKRIPTQLSAEARYGINLSFNGKNSGWILDGNKTSGFIFYGDWNADGDLSNDKPIKFKRNKDGKDDFEYHRELTETVGNSTQQYQYDLKARITGRVSSGNTEKSLAIAKFSQTLRKGILTVNGRKITFGLIGSNGIYDTQNENLYFDLNNNGNFETKDIYSPEKYGVSEKYINIDDKTYEFSVDRYGRDLTLKLLPEKLPARSELTIDHPAPDISFTDIDNKTHRLSDFRGKIVLLDFWGTWCRPCVAEAPKLAAVYKRLKEKGFEIISLDQGDTIEILQKFIAEREMNWTHSQLNEEISKLYRIKQYPTYFLLDKDGKIVTNDLRAGEEMYQKIDQMLSE